MRCIHCHNQGTPVGRWWTRPHRTGNPWIVFQCNNPSCRFSFRSAIDGSTKHAQPRWMCPERWMEAAHA